MAYAIIKTGGKQYRVAVGDKIDIERIDANPGDSATFPTLFYSNDADIRIGDPVLDGVKVSAKVLEQHRARKVIAFKYKKRKGYHRTIGHRRELTRVQIESISL
ncbi:MAG: 50S ribosomal protein L21 [Verrucomicrobiales bacterium]|nr:50S ribosomal protein L21 [Verrucomicrobiales bacterium]